MADICVMEFPIPIVNFVSTAASIAVAIWFARVDFPEKIPCHEVTENNLDETVLRVIEELRKGNTTESKYIWRKIECSVNIPDNSKDASVAQIIKQSYDSDESYFEETLSFTHDAIHQAQFKIRGYKELYYQMNISNHIYNRPQVFTLASVIQAERFFNELSSMFPKEVWMFILNKEVALRNAESGGSLFVGGKGVFYNQEKGQRNVLVWKPGNLGPQGKWQFILNNDGQTFKILNTYWNLCLCEDEWPKRFDDRRGNVYASSCANEDFIEGGAIKNNKWNVILAPGKDGRSYIKIKSAVTNQESSLLYSETNTETDLDSYRSRVFVSYYSDEAIENKSMWRVSIFR